MANFCGNCGNKVNENEIYCSRCGVSLNNNNNSYSNDVSNINDDGGLGWAVLGYFIPLVGLILYIAWNKEKPKTAKAVGKGALISVIVGFVLTIIFGLFVFRIISKFEYNDIYDDDFHIRNDYDDYMYDFE